MGKYATDLNGNISEQGRNDRFVDIVGGRQRAEQLSRIYQNSYPMPGHCIAPAKSKTEVFMMKAKRERFTQKEINAFMAL